MILVKVEVEHMVEPSRWIGHFFFCFPILSFFHLDPWHSRFKSFAPYTQVVVPLTLPFWVDSLKTFLHQHGSGRIVQGIEEAVHTMKVHQLCVLSKQLRLVPSLHLSFLLFSHMCVCLPNFFKVTCYYAQFKSSSKLCQPSICFLSLPLFFRWVSAWRCSPRGHAAPIWVHRGEALRARFGEPCRTGKRMSMKKYAHT